MTLRPRSVIVCLLGLAVLTLPFGPFAQPVHASSAWSSATIVAATVLAQTSPPDPAEGPGMAPVGKGRSLLRGKLTESEGAASAPAAKNPSSASSPTPTQGPAETAETGSFVDGMVQFIRSYATWIVAALGLVFIGMLAWTYLGARGTKGASRDVLGDLGFVTGPAAKSEETATPKRFSSTKIQKADIADSMGRKVKTTEVETDREYALVVDEADLKKPPLPEEESEGGAADAVDAAKVSELVEARKLTEAYEEYSKQVSAKPGGRFPAPVEKALGDGMLKSGELEKAARVLEHYVTTQARESIAADAYFNLGYIHFMHRTFNKSRRFFKLFLDAEKNPEYLARARKIIQKMDERKMRR